LHIGCYFLAGDHDRVIREVGKVTWDSLPNRGFSNWTSLSKVVYCLHAHNPFLWYCSRKLSRMA
jgi:hypothetical protein